MELSKQQRAIVQTPESQVIVIASAAAGKTATLVARVQYLLQNGVDPKEIVLITFTNAAADELADRLGRPQGLFCGTIHSYANYLLRANGEDTSDLLEQEQFDRLFDRIEDNPQCLRHVSHLLLDESQDSTELQFRFLLDMVNPDNYMLVGDYRQSIYRWAGADPQYLIDLMGQDDVVTYDLNENYRNGVSILRYAQSIIQLAGYDYIDNSKPMRMEYGRVCTVDYEPIRLAQSIKAWGEYKDWFVLARTNDQVDEIARVLTKMDVPCDTFKRSQLDNAELFKRLHDDKVKVLTIHTSKGLEAKNVAVIGAKFYNIEEKCISYVAATRARDLLVWTKMPTKPQRQKKVTNWET